MSHTLRSTYVLVFAVLSTLFLMAMLAFSEARAQSSVDCSAIRSQEDAAGFTKYGSALSFFGAVTLPFLTTTCHDSSTVTLNAGHGEDHQYIYKYGYQRVDGKWQKFAFTGDDPRGPWFRGSAQKTFDNNTAGKDSGAYLAYICEKVDGRWKCGCKDKACTKQYWQRQEHDRTRIHVPALPTIAQDDVSFDTNGRYPGTKEEVLAADPRDYGWEADTTEVFDIYYLSEPSGLSGDALVLYGAEFGLQNNYILWDGMVKQSNLPSENDGHEIKVVVPNLAPGAHEVSVRYDGDTTEHAAVFWVRDPAAAQPVIKGVEPEELRAGDTVTITGSGFSADSNYVTTTFGVVDDVRSSDGMTLELVFDPFEKETKFTDMQGNYTRTVFPVYFTVTNSGGSSESVQVNLVF